MYKRSSNWKTKNMLYNNNYFNPHSSLSSGKPKYCLLQTFCMSICRCGGRVLPLKPTNHATTLLLPWKGLQNTQEISKPVWAGNILTSDAFSCAFPERRMQRKEAMLRQMAVKHCEQWQRDLNMHMLNLSKNFTFCLQMRCTSRRRKCPGICSVTDRN